MNLFSHLPASVLQCLAIFLSIIIEALPFVFMGAILSGFIEVYVTPDRVQGFLPKNKVLRILFGTLAGLVFPSCECGIVPIITRFIEKKVPSYTAIPFLITAPIINPIVLFATYSAFGNSWRYVFLRFIGAILVANVMGILLGFVINDQILKPQIIAERPLGHQDEDQLAPTGPKKVFAALAHAVDEFFDTGRYLVFGALVAASMQIYVPTRLLTSISQTPLIAILLMMLLAFILSLCSEADAFIGASLLSTFGMAPVLAFLLFGPLVDIKNLLMMGHAFKTRFIVTFVSVSVAVILSYCLIVGVI
ncbi:permease [Streptococcus sp. DD12]|uniref:permease n=1 Tax=Streptococcus sp. DD12 TaxID=1777880 RepID=UPI0007920EC9|nr:permease [Streptococcus sp. DD12]KXT76887.1 putative permease [Streptococcus sp. DD12]